METPQASESARSTWIFRAALAGAGLVAMLLVLIATAPYGLWADPDSVVYADVARHLANGEGIVATNIHGEPTFVFTWPPLYPLLMSPFVLVGIEPHEAARWLNALANAALSVLIGLCALLLTGRRAAALTAGWLTAFASTLLINGGSFWSEPIFLAIQASALLCLLHWTVSSSRRWLIAGGVLIGLGCLQRYAGYAFIAGAALWVAQLRGTKHERLRNTGLLLAVAVPLPLVWRICVLIFAGEVDARGGFSFAWPDLLHMRATGYAVAAWLFPPSWPTAIRMVLVAMIATGMAIGMHFALKQRVNKEEDRLVERASMLLALLALAYMGIVATTILFIDHPLQANERIMSPLLPMILLALVWFAFKQKGQFRTVCFVLLGLLGFSYAVRDYHAIRLIQRGQAYASPRWVDSSLLEIVRELPDVPMASNEREVLMYYTGREVAAVPVDEGFDILLPPGQTPFPSPIMARKDLLKRLAAKRGYVAWFYDAARSDLPPELTDLRVVAECDDGLLLMVE